MYIYNNIADISGLERNVPNMMDKTYRQLRKNPDCNSKRNQHNPSEVRASSSYAYEKQQNNNKNKTRTNLENFVLKERLVDKSGWQHVYQADECALHGAYVRATTGIEL